MDNKTYPSNLRTQLLLVQVDFTGGDDHRVLGCFADIVSRSRLRHVFMRADACSITVEGQERSEDDWTEKDVAIAARALGLGSDGTMLTFIGWHDTAFEREWTRAVQTYGSVSRPVCREMPTCWPSFWEDVDRLKVLMDTKAPLDDASQVLFSRIDEQLARGMHTPLTQSTLRRHGSTFEVEGCVDMRDEETPLQWHNKRYCECQYSEDEGEDALKAAVQTTS